MKKIKNKSFLSLSLVFMFVGCLADDTFFAVYFHPGIEPNAESGVSSYPMCVCSMTPGNDEELPKKIAFLVHLSTHSMARRCGWQQMLFNLKWKMTENNRIKIEFN